MPAPASPLPQEFPHLSHLPHPHPHLSETYSDVLHLSQIHPHNADVRDGDAGYECISDRDELETRSSLQEMAHLMMDMHLPAYPRPDFSKCTFISSYLQVSPSSPICRICDTAAELVFEQADSRASYRRKGEAMGYDDYVSKIYI